MEPLALHLALEIGLRERRPLIGRIGLGADQRQRPRMAERTQPGDQGSAGLAGPDDHDSGRFRIHQRPRAGFAGPFVYMGRDMCRNSELDERR